MKWIRAVFSPTGTTDKVAGAILAAQEAECIDLSASVEVREIEKDTVLLAAAPVYGGRIPEIALERLSALKGRGGPAVAVAVYGNRHYDDALLELKDALEKNGFRVVAAAAFVAEHSIVRSIAAGRPDAADLKTAAEFGAAVAAKLEKPEVEQSPVHVPGNPEYKARGGAAAHPTGDDKCVKCGLCATRCPLGAIPAEAPATTGDTCINCMRCVAICPVKARALPEAMTAATKAKLETIAAVPRQPELFL